MRVIGTAGHVDHGKSTLVSALTGIHPDRLKEEQEREMTIELGFAWLNLPGGEEVGVVDVPGHRDFIENMLAGVGGIDAVLFVIAADEGVMPQTREHLAIVDILQVAGGVIALTKIDLVTDPEWLELVEADIRQAVQGTVLQDAPLVRVSARRGLGLDELKQKLADCLSQCPLRPNLGRARLPIDRVFTIAGFGTVVTGTLSDGVLHLGDEVEILPSGVRGRVRSLQTHKKKETEAVQGSRTAVNVAGLDVEQIQRGNTLALPGRYIPTQRLDAHFELIQDAAGKLNHSDEVKLFIGASEVVARVRLLGVDELNPGEAGWLQLELRDPVVAVRGDRYILRRPSPGETLGGGVVVDPHPAGRHKRFAPAVLAQLETLRQGTPAEVLLQAFSAGPLGLREAVNRARLNAEQSAAALSELVQTGQLLLLEPGEASPGADILAAAAAPWEDMTRRAQQELEAYHRSYPLRKGMPREELKSRLKLAPRLFTAAMRRWAADGHLLDLGTLTARAGFSVKLNPEQQAAVKRLLVRFAAEPFSPPTIKDCQTEVGEELYTALIETDRLVAVSAEVCFRREDYDRLRREVVAHLQNSQTLTAAEFRDKYNTSRRYALAFLEHLDALGVTRREGDVRTLGRAGR